MRIMIGALVLLASSTALGQDYLYKPQPVAQGEQPAAAEGVLVREVLVKKGDTLSHISKRFSGRGSYYPQILLFNSIKNPNLIYPGDLLRVPVKGQGEAQQAAVPSKPAVASSRPARTTPAAAGTKATAKPAAIATAPQPSAEQASYGRAMEAFKRGDCSQAVQLFDRFIAEYPTSSLLPEATLSRAECYLKLSAH